MEIAIPKSLEALVRRKVEEGHYSTEEEVVADALRLMQARGEAAEINEIARADLKSLRRYSQRTWSAERTSQYIAALPETMKGLVATPSLRPADGYNRKRCDCTRPLPSHASKR